MPTKTAFTPTPETFVCGVCRNLCFVSREYLADVGEENPPEFCIGCACGERIAGEVARGFYIAHETDGMYVYAFYDGQEATGYCETDIYDSRRAVRDALLNNAVPRILGDMVGNIDTPMAETVKEVTDFFSTLADDVCRELAEGEV